MRELFVDTETTGFVHRSKPLDHEKQPYLVQLAMILRDSGKDVAQANFVVKCPIEIPEEARKVHGYDQDRTLAIGIGSFEACTLLMEMCYPADRIVAHHADFDRKVLEIALSRHGCLIPWAKTGDRWFCTMKAAEPHCRIPATEGQIKAGFKKPGDFKNPKLEEALKILRGEALENAHDALADVRGCIKVYDWLMSLDKAA